MSLRVLHVIASRDRRGAEVFASSLVRALAGEGASQRVAALRGTNWSTVGFDVPVAQLANGGPILPGVRMDLGTIRSLRRAMRQFKPDIVQVHGGEPLKYALAADRGRGARIVYRRIGDCQQFGRGRLRRRAYAGLMGRAARVVAVSEVLRSELVDGFGLAPTRVVTIPNGVDPSRLLPSRTRTEIRAALGIPDDAEVVLSLGALTWEKGPFDHLRAVAGVVTAHPKVVHIMAGDGPLRESVEAEALRLGIRDRTMLLGVRDDVADLLAASDVMLLASKSEGMPACVIEAGIAGLPVVAYAISGVPDVVVDGETGSLVAPGDGGGLARALNTLLSDDELRRRMAGAAQERCRARFDIRAVAPMYLRVYEEVARATSPAPRSSQRGILP